MLQIQKPLVTSLGRLSKTPFGYLRLSASHRIMMIIIATTTHAFCSSCLLPQLIRKMRRLDDEVGTCCYNSNLNFLSSSFSPEMEQKCSVTEKSCKKRIKDDCYGEFPHFRMLHVLGSLSGWSRARIFQYISSSGNDTFDNQPSDGCSITR